MSPPGQNILRTVLHIAKLPILVAISKNAFDCTVTKEHMTTMSIAGKHKIMHIIPNRISDVLLTFSIHYSDRFSRGPKVQQFYNITKWQSD